MTTTSASSTISSLGVGSGLDANSIVTKLVAIERQPISDLQTAADKIQTKISAFGQIQSSVSALRDAAQKLTNPSLWSSTTPTSSDAAAVSFSTSSGAAVGSYSVSVSALAASQSVVNKTAYASSTATVGSGTLTFDMGTWSGNSFTGVTPAAPVSVTVAATDTLENIRDKINASTAGVSASIIKDASGSRLVMTSKATGAANGFRVTAADDDLDNADASGLSNLAYDPSSSTAGTRQTQAAANAAATINGVDVTSSSNTFADVLSGITVTVGKLVPSTAPTTVTVAQDNTTITKAITDFAAAYTSLSNLLTSNTKYDAGSKVAGTLQGDSTAVGLLNQFRRAIGSGSSASSVFATLSDAGLQVQTGGGLTVNSTKLTSALSNLGELKKMFSAAGTSAGGDDGFATRLRSLGDTLLGTAGALTSRTAGLNQSIKNNQKQQDAIDNKATLYEKRLRAQYTALDKTMAGITSQGNYVSQMITQMNKG